jgi:hypothetical protein
MRSHRLVYLSRLLCIGMLIAASHSVAEGVVQQKGADLIDNATAGTPPPQRKGADLLGEAASTPRPSNISFGDSSKAKLIILYNPNAPTFGNGHLGVALLYHGVLHYWSYSQENDHHGRIPGLGVNMNPTLPYGFEFKGGLDDFAMGELASVALRFGTHFSNPSDRMAEIKSDVRQYSKALYRNITDRTAQQILNESPQFFRAPYNFFCGNECAGAVERVVSLDPQTAKTITHIHQSLADRATRARAGASLVYVAAQGRGSARNRTRWEQSAALYTSQSHQVSE